MKTTTTLLLSGLLAGCASAPPPAAEPTTEPDLDPPPQRRDVREVLPSADALFERALEVAGGRRALLALEGYRATGRMQSPEGLSGAITVLARAPRHLRSTLVLESGLRFEEGFDGELAWSNDPVRGARVKTGAERLEVARRADLRARARYAETYPERETLGQAEFRGAPAWEVVTRTATGLEQRHYFHRETGRELGLRARVRAPSGEVPVEVGYGDWRSVGGVELPFVVVNEVASTAQQVMRIEEISVERPPLDAFTPPAAVRALRSEARPSGAAPAPRP